MNVATSSSASDNAEDKPRWLTAVEALDMAAVSYSTLKNWVKSGRLHSQKEMRLLPNGQRREIRVFNPAELLKIPHQRDPISPDELAARAFEMFGEGRTISEVVFALWQTPERIEQLHDAWERCGARELVITPVAKREL